MKFGYLVDDSIYAPAYISASCLTEAITILENKVNVVSLARKKDFGKFVEIWVDAGIDRKDMVEGYLKDILLLYPSISGKFICNDLCERIWTGICQEGRFTNTLFSYLSSDMYGFGAGTQVNAIFDWLNKHYTGGLQSLIYNTRYPFEDGEPFVYCKYISEWEGYGEVESLAKYNPITHEVFDVETAELSDYELAECEILTGEYMKLLGKRFPLEETENAAKWFVPDKDPINVVSGMKIYPPVLPKRKTNKERNIKVSKKKSVENNSLDEKIKIANRCKSSIDIKEKQYPEQKEI